MFIQKEYKLIPLQRQLQVYAKSLRYRSTPAEKKLWRILRSEPFRSAHFRRQHPLYSYIADFYSRKYKLIIELDGPIHNHRIPYDNSRDAFFRARGYTIIRYKNEQVLLDINQVITDITNNTLS